MNLHPFLILSFLAYGSAIPCSQNTMAGQFIRNFLINSDSTNTQTFPQRRSNQNPDMKPPAMNQQTLATLSPEQRFKLIELLAEMNSEQGAGEKVPPVSSGQGQKQNPSQDLLAGNGLGSANGGRQDQNQSKSGLREPKFLAGIYQVSGPKDAKRLCTGAILHDNAIITTAQCVDQQNLQDIRTQESLIVHVGAAAEIAKDQLYTVAAVEIHPEYTQANATNDVAIIYLCSGIKAKNTERIEIQGARVLGLASGHPVLLSTLDDKEKVQIIELQVTDFTTCNHMFRNKLQIDSDFCAISFKNGTEICKADFGSPLSSTGSNVVYGLLSKKRTSCTNEGTPAVFTYLPSVYSFLNSALNRQSVGK